MFEIQLSYQSPGWIVIFTRTDDFDELYVVDTPTLFFSHVLTITITNWVQRGIAPYQREGFPR